MSEVKRYDMRVSLGGVESYESPCGDYVDYEDYAALEAKCAEVAAEVEAVKSAHQDAVNTIMYTAKRTGVLYTEKTIQISCKTTATDAFLAEVRAQGVEMFADHLLCPDLDGTIRDFAAKLRKGGN